MKPKILVIAGPTAVGKTKLSIELAKRLNGEIISADSMQIYKDMNIGTAKPTAEEMDGIKHHLIDFLEVGETFSVAQYKEMAMKCVEDILARGKTPIFCGGTGLYINSIVEEIKYGDVSESKEIRENLEKISMERGNQELYEELKRIDPKATERIHLNDTKRIIRALEVYKLTGETITEQQLRSKEIEKKYDYKIVGLNMDREKLYNRINLRVDEMVKLGLIDEAKSIIDEITKLGKITSFQAIGYKEFVPYFDGNCALQEATDSIKQESRHYAKRQITWFKRTPGIRWIDADRNFGDILSEILNFFEQY